MKFIYKDLGQRRRGDVVEVQLSGSTANVLLMDSSNFSSFKRNGSYRQAYGGAWKRSPLHLSIPGSGHWYGVIFIPHGYTGRLAGFQILPGLLPELRQSAPLGAIREAAEEYAESVGIEPEDKEYDVFISHAGEDKADVSDPRRGPPRSRAGGLYDEFELRIGDSLRREIDQGIVRPISACSRCRRRSSARDGPSTSWTDS